MPRQRIAVVEDESAIARLLQINLQAAGYEARTYDTGEAFLASLATGAPDVLLLDWMLPGKDGLDICRIVRASPETAALPIIMLTAKTEEIDKVLGLEMGADDYVTKPFGVREVLARVKAQLRRAAVPGAAAQDTLRCGALVLDLPRRQALADGQLLALSFKEYELLAALMEHPGWVCSREALLQKVWGYDFEGETRTVDMHIANLRKKLEEMGMGLYVQTVRGAGYRLRAPGEDGTT
ncbi:MAG: response regulator transcription factor [Eubacteriales bacterium]|nr:response regulator transcription factor [Eubacteriales bacterium]